MGAVKQTLVELVPPEFQNLTEAEAKLLRAAATGDPADCRGPTEGENDPKHAEAWGEPRTIRAGILRWLCADREAVKHVDPKGIRIEAAKIIDQLDFEAVTIPFPLALTRCAIQNGINLRRAETRQLSFEGSVSGSIIGPGLAVRGDIFLSQGFWAQGGVDLMGATITGDMGCHGGMFCNPGGLALQASKVQVGRVVYLHEGFRAVGEVQLIGAAITRDLECRGGRFDNSSGNALQASEVTVGGDVTLAKGFHATGKVSLVGARIAGMLACQGGRFDNQGLIDLTGGNIGSHLNFNGAQFIDKAQNGLLAENLTVRGIFDWRKVVKTDGTILDLWGARVGQLADDKSSWPKCQNLDVDDFIYAAIADGPVDATTRVDWLKRQASRLLNPALKQQVSRPFTPKPYQQLVKVLRESGHEAAAKRILIAKEWARGERGDLGLLAYLWNWLLYLAIGYGYRPWQALLWAAVWIVLGGILFGMGYHKEIVIPAKAEAYDPTKKIRQEPAFYPAFRPLLYSLDTFVPIINFGQKDYWGPQVACNRSWLTGGNLTRLCVCGTRALYLYRWVHIGVGWMLITLVVAGFTGLVRKE